MKTGDFSTQDLAALRRRRPRSSVSRAVPCALALTVSTAAGLWFLYASAPVASSSPQERLVVQNALHQQANLPSRRDGSTPAVAVFKAAAPPIRQAMRLDPSFIAPDYVADYRPMTFARVVSIRAGSEPDHARISLARLEQPEQPATEAREAPPAAVTAAGPPAATPSEAKGQDESPQVSTLTAPDESEQILPLLPPLAVQTVPVPTARPAPPAPKSQPQPLSRRLALSMQPAAPETPGPRSFFDRMFRPNPQPNTALAYAAPEDGGLGLIDAVRKAAPDRLTAVYDIAAHTVTLPDGTRLEAHSGLGARLDDPRSVAEHMRGATPPAVYELSPREALFHGVAALRLNPVSGTTYGRAGLLAHTYMLGPRGDSNGCVVFKDYRAFRRAYDAGAIRRLVVVSRSS